VDVRDLDMEGILVAWQMRQTPASFVAEIAAHTRDAGSATARLGAMVGRPREEIAAEINASLAELLGENGGEELVDDEASWGAVVHTARRIVAGEIRPGLGALTIAYLRNPRVPLRDDPHWEDVRPFVASWEQIHPDVDPYPELIRIIEERILDDARALLEREER
jgi:hypothetical protein